MTPLVADARLAIPAVVGWVVLGVAVGAPDSLVPAAIAGWIVAGLLGAGLLCAGLLCAGLLGAGAFGEAAPRGRRVLATLTVVAALVALLLTSAAVQSAARRPAALVDAAGHGRQVSLVADLDATVTVDRGDGAVLPGGRRPPCG